LDEQIPLRRLKMTYRSEFVGVVLACDVLMLIAVAVRDGAVWVTTMNRTTGVLVKVGIGG
jgi:hypothetical protein